MMMHNFCAYIVEGLYHGREFAQPSQNGVSYVIGQKSKAEVSSSTCEVVSLSLPYKKSNMCFSHALKNVVSTRFFRIYAHRKSLNFKIHPINFNEIDQNHYELRGSVLLG